MIFQIPPFQTSAAERSAGLLLSMLLVATSAQAAVQDITVGGPPCVVNSDYSYAADHTPPSTANEIIGVSGADGNVEWDFYASEGSCTIMPPGPTTTTATCAGSLTVTIPNGEVAQSMKPPLTGNGTGTGEGRLTLSVTDVGGKCGIRKYTLRVTDDGGGWGDPHMTTVDGVHYDFQSAGEFTALKEDNFEVQTRQRPVPMATVPGPSEYTGLGVCVSIYSAVAVRIGSNRVTLQPNLSGQPDPSGLQLRVNGKLVTLTDRGIDLRACRSTESSAQLEGRITKAVGGAYEFTDAGGTQLIATPAYWEPQQTWYLNLSIYQTSATQGIWGRLAPDSWLPALPDGTSLGPRPEPPQQRYQDLYEKFADAWRVTNATSLFDYAPGTNTGTFTLDEWPRFNPQSCALQEQPSVQPSVQPTTQQAAEQACSGVTGAAQKADCIFDVTVTGETGFAQSYEAMQRFKPHGTGFQPVLTAEDVPPPPAGTKKLPWWLWLLIGLGMGIGSGISG